jgi:asparagine synthase (glutamine-hydrolysing)
MCGVSGFVSTNGKIKSQTIQKMNNLIKHRGPDDEGFLIVESLTSNALPLGGPDTAPVTAGGVFDYYPKSGIGDYHDKSFSLMLGHRRLSILDVSSAGHQPMSVSNGRFWISYNGEVYNYLELREELQKCGETFKTHTDTEVILKAYEKWGSACLQKFNGMFAFLIYDSEKKVLFCGRDRFGVKPLYYWISEAGVAFASEIKQFTAFPNWSAKLNHQKAYDFLNWSILDHSDETLFENVYQFRGGQFIEINLTDLKLPTGGRLKLQDWYSLKPKKFEGSYKDAVAEFRKLFKSAVNLRMRSDVPIGSCLSGGLDSSSIVCVVNKILEENSATNTQATFSACSDYKKVDESYFIDIVSKSAKTQSYKFTPNYQDVLKLKDKIVWHQDEPFGSTSIMAQWGVFELAKSSKVTVMLDGQGADEQLAGYDGYLFAKLAWNIKHLKFKQFLIDFNKTKKFRGYSSLFLISACLNYLLPNRLRIVGRKLFGKSSNIPTWLNLNLLNVNTKDPLYHHGAISSDIQKISLSQLTKTNLQMLLHWEDRDSMAHSIESRLPFLDFRLVEFVLGLPEDFKIASGITKRILRDAMENILPKEIQNRMDKIGFATAEEDWIKNTARAEFKSHLKSAIADSKGVLSESLLSDFEKMADGKSHFSYHIWRAISFGSWMKQFNVKV